MISKKMNSEFYGLLALVTAICFPFITPFKHPPLASYHAELLTFLLGLVFISITAWRKFLVIDYSITAVLTLFSIMIYFTAPAILKVPVFMGFIALVFFYNSVVGWVRQYNREFLFSVICWALAASALINALAGVFQLMGWGDLGGIFFFTLKSAIPRGQVGQNNHFANILFVGLVAGAWLFDKGFVNKYIFILFVVLLDAPLSFSSSRAIYLYAAGFVFLPAFVKGYVRSRFNLIICSSVFLLFVFIFVFNYSFNVDLSGVQNESSIVSRSVLDSSTSTRFWLWARAWDVFVHHPIAGVGFNHWAGQVFGLASVPHVPFPSVIEFGGHSHNLFLQIAAEMGLIGVSAVLVFIGVVLFRLRRVSSPVTVPVFLILWVEFIHSMLEYPLWYFNFLFVLFSVVAVLIPNSERIAKIPFRIEVCFSFIGVIFVVFLAYSLFQYHEVTRYWRSMEASHKGQLGFDNLWLISANPIVRIPAEMTLVKFMSVGKDGADEKINILNELIEYSPYPLAIAKKIQILRSVGKESEAVSLEYGLKNLYGLDATLNHVTGR